MIHFLILTVLLVGPRYPASTDPHVNDFAKVLSAKDVEHIGNVAKETLRDRGVPIVVATITSLADYDAADWTIERYGTNLYNEWGIGDRTSNKGVLLLVAVRDRKLRIATGTGLGNLDGPARQVIDTVIVPRLKSGDLSGGISAGVDAIAKWFHATGQTGGGPLPGPVGPAPDRVPGGEGAGWNPHGTAVRNAGRGGFGCFTWVIIIVIGLVVFSKIFRNRSGYSTGGGSGYGGGAYGGGGGGWGRFMLGGLAGFLGSQFLQGRGRGRQWGGSDSGSSSYGGGSSGGFFGGGGSSGGGSSFGGGSSSGGGASGSW